MRAAICLGLLFVIGSLSASGQELPDRPLSLPDGGQVREFEVATDEVQMAGSHRVEQLAGPQTGEQARQAARRLRVPTGERPQLVLYERGKERSAATRRVVTDQIAVKLRPGSDPQQVAAGHGLRLVGPISSAPGFVLMEALEVGGSLSVLPGLQSAEGVLEAEPQLARQQQKRLLPSDPYFAQQWHLQNTGQGSGLAGTDANVTSVWDTFRGAGVRIGIVDDGLETTHPDLAPNVDEANDRDWNDLTPDDPRPDTLWDFHGTACAGVAAGRGNNGIGISGAAPEATLVGLRLIAAASTDLQEAEAMSWKNDIIQIKSNSWGPQDDGRRLEGPGTLTAQALSNAAQNGRGGRGTIFVWAAGNGGSFNDNANNDGYANSRFTIAVGAIGNNGRKAYYSEPGANVLIAAPSDGASLGIVTTDLRGNPGYNGAGVTGNLSSVDYTNDFGGTSSATPLVAGFVALMLEANPLLGWRDVQEILIRSATKVEPGDSDWTTNSAGFHFNHKYGAGMVNSAESVALAQDWTNLGEEISAAREQSGLPAAIPDNNVNGLNRQFDFSDSNIRAERVTVKVNIEHTSRGQLAITLISPSGTESRLTEKHTDSNDHISNWTFSSVRHWGENSQGTWTLRVADLGSSNTGRLLAATVTIFGTSAGPINQPPRVTSAQLSASDVAYSDQRVEVTEMEAVDEEGDEITFTYRWLVSDDGANYLAIPEATSSSLLLADQQLGRLIRCEIRPEAAGKKGAAFLSEPLHVMRRPLQLVNTGAAYSFDAELFVPKESVPTSRNVIINEFSQGADSAKEWVELLVLRNSDLRGYSLGDRLGTYCIFKDHSTWADVAAGTLIVFYKATERDTLIPATPDIDPTDGKLIIPHNHATLLAPGTGWNGLSNTAVESILVKDAAGAIVDALSLNNQNVYEPKLGTVGAGRAARYLGGTDFGADLVEEWQNGTSSTATPGNGNSTANTAFVQELRRMGSQGEAAYRLASDSEAVPGLTFDPLTGTLSGTPDVPGGGIFSIRIERFTNSDTSEQSFTLVVADAAGNVRVPAGKTWAMVGDVTVTGNLAIDGVIQSNGNRLTVNQTLNLSVGGSIQNASGTIEYRHRDGARIAGRTSLLPDPANDAADPDGDGQSNLMEFLLGSNPSSAAERGFFEVSVVDDQLQAEYDEQSDSVGAALSPQVSWDLEDWQSGAPHTERVSATGNGPVKRVIVRDLGPGPNRFMRLHFGR